MTRGKSLARAGWVLLIYGLLIAINWDLYNASLTGPLLSELLYLGMVLGSTVVVVIVLRLTLGWASFRGAGMELLCGCASAGALVLVWGVFELRRAQEIPALTGVALAALAVLGGAEQVREFPLHGWRSVLLGVIVGVFMSAAFLFIKWLPQSHAYRSSLWELTPILFWPAGMLFAHWFWSRRLRAARAMR